MDRAAGPLPSPNGSASAAEAKYRTLVENIPLVVYIDALDNVSSNLYTNPQCIDLLGYTPEEWYADAELFAKVLHPNDRARVLAEHVHANRTATALQTEYRFLARDGRVVWVRDDSVVVRDDADRPLFRQGFLLDLTEKKRRDEALALSEEQFRSAFDHAPIGMALVSREGRWLRVNEALCDIVGYSEQELLERNFQEITHPDDLDADVAHVRRLLAGEVRCYEIEKRYLHRDGRLVWVLLSVSLVRDAQGGPLHFISQIQDVTERRQLEAQLRQSQKMEAVGRLAGGVAHDFNNLLTAISGYSELILERHSPSDRDHRNAEQIRRSAERAAQLTAQLLAFSRRQVLQPQMFCFDDAVAGIGDLLRRLIGEHVAIRRDLGAGRACVKADRTQIEQVVVNLAVNARDAMPGGGRLSIATSVVSVPVPAWPETELEPGPYVVLEVSDTGHGMDARTRTQVFEPFFTTKPVGEGTGLGLATVYGTVKQSGGDVTVASVLGRGTTFRVLLPLADAPAEPTPETTANAAPDGTETILLAEDEDVVRALVRELLEERGYAVLEAAHPEEALELARAHTGSLDLLLTDVVMPGMSGPALAEQLERLRPHLPVLYTSAYTNERIAGGADANGAVNFIQKPFSAEDLSTKVRDVLNGSAAAGGRVAAGRIRPISA
jgi:two-component system, cell cycle sensor histidine kinase and response regulator CckA